MTEQKDIIQGRVKWFNSKRGFGVVSFKINDEDNDAFIHHSNIMIKGDVYKELFENEVIEFKLNRQDDKYYALEIRGQNGGPLLCEKSEDKKPKNKKTNSNKKKNKKKRFKNTETFEPSHEPADMNVTLGNPYKERFDRVLDPRDIIVVPNLFCEEEDESIYEKLLEELKATGKEDEGLWKLWHGDTHLIADDHIDWKDSCPTFNMVVEKIKKYFKMSATATRFNWYRDSSEWKPYHHDAAAVKPHIAKIQNLTIGVSFGAERDVSFQHAKNRAVVNVPLPNGTTYGFMNQVNVDWRHGIPQLPPEQQNDKGRISIIVWGWRD